MSQGCNLHWKETLWGPTYPFGVNKAYVYVCTDVPTWFVAFTPRWFIIIIMIMNIFAVIVTYWLPKHQGFCRIVCPEGFYFSIQSLKYSILKFFGTSGCSIKSRLSFVRAHFEACTLKDPVKRAVYWTYEIPSWSRMCGWARFHAYVLVSFLSSVYFNVE